MKRFLTVLGILALLACFVHPTMAASATDKPKEQPSKPVFVDLDGDGFDDNAAVSNPTNNTDQVKKDTNAATVEVSATSGSFFDFDRSLLPTKEVFLTNSSAFASSKQRVCCGTQSRGGFGTSGDFGPGNDIGSGAVVGGTCVGGVCH